MPSRVNIGWPTIRIGVNTYINTVVKITILGFHQQVKRELRFWAIKSELFLEGTRASGLPPDGYTLPILTPLNAPSLARSRRARTKHLFAPYDTNPTCWQCETSPVASGSTAIAWARAAASEWLLA